MAPRKWAAPSPPLPAARVFFTAQYHTRTQGNFFPKDNKNPSYAYKKWPVMHPGHTGFDEWFSTEASASSTMCNCGCRPEWPAQAPGCVIGGGVYVLNQSYACTNYWFPTNDTSAACASPARASLACVTNSTTKIPGDDSLFQLARFEAFLNASLAAGKPFFATMQLHTNHQPHPALPEFFHAYNDSNGQPAGDYLGTLTQMDAAVGALVALLRGAGVFNNTLIWYAADNGPHIGPPGGIPVKNTASNGLRQCKASVFEGGIHVPGFVSWPAAIAANRRTATPVYVPDFLPTVLDVLGMAHPQPAFASDGESILPLIRGAAPFSRARFLAWRLGAQVALLDAEGRYKYVRNGDAGQCDKDGSAYPYKGAYVFDLSVDPTESAPLANSTKLAEMGALAAAWEASIANSQVNESQCLPGGGGGGAVRFQRGGGGCLTAAGAREHAAVSAAGACAPAGSLNEWAVDPASGAVTLARAAGGWCFHEDNQGGSCAAGTAVWMGAHCDGAMAFDAPTGTFKSPGCPGMCAGVAKGGALALAKCSDAAATGWVVLGGGWRGSYVQPFD
jgi:hypothetical protein